mmetsp:Transcript_30491/g.75694  ORF Transcript_30491/g.75694 Transcript_30491/m.75694 type:complete len:85 (-) Transcript_30491:38-292(-)
MTVPSLGANEGGIALLFKSAPCLAQVPCLGCGSRLQLPMGKDRWMGKLFPRGSNRGAIKADGNKRRHELEEICAGSVATEVLRG